MKKRGKEMHTAYMQSYKHRTSCRTKEMDASSRECIQLVRLKIGTTLFLDLER